MSEAAGGHQKLLRLPECFLLFMSPMPQDMLAKKLIERMQKSREIW